MSRKIAAVIVFYLFTGVLMGRAAEPADAPATNAFDGDWRGKVKVVQGSGTGVVRQFRIVINGATALAYDRNNGKEDWEEIADKDTGVVTYSPVAKMADLCVVTWLNHYEVWTEEQTYSLSYVNPTKLKLVAIRHVTNREKDNNGVPWYYVSVGTLKKTGADEQDP